MAAGPFGEPRVTLDREAAAALHRDTPVVDLHVDTTKLMVSFGFDITRAHRPAAGAGRYLGHVDVPRLQSGGVAAQFFGLWTFPYPESGCKRAVLRQLDALEAAARAIPDALRMAKSAADIRAARGQQAIAALTGIEGGHALEGRLENLELFARRGVRYVGLLHFTPNAIGWPAHAALRRNRPDAGLTPFGQEVIREMARLGMIVDLAHINRAGFFDALGATRDPVFVSHTGVFGVHEHWRNIDDEQLRAVAQNGGCVGVIFSRRYLGGATLDAVADHLLHVIQIAGEDTPALGSDFDGFVTPPRGLEDVSELPHLTRKLSERGLSESVLRKILGENALRVIEAVPPRV